MKIKIIALTERKYTMWIDGFKIICIDGCLKLYIIHSKYNDIGSWIVNCKCPVYNQFQEILLS
jgi:hypothetical protein